jgi:protein TonB
MRRRRQKNPLILRLTIIAILIHIAALPVLAHFGALKKLERHFVETRMVVLPPTHVEHEKQEVRRETHTSHSMHRASASNSHTRQAGHARNYNAPKVVAATGGPDGEGDEDNSVEQGTLKPGELPTAPKQPAAAPAQKSETQTQQAPPSTEAVAPKEASKPAPAPPSVPAAAPAPPHTPVFSDAAVLDAPKAVIPDDLRRDALDKTVITELTVMPDGSVTDVKVVQSAGSDELDRIALETARQYRFKPAERDGAPVESRIRLHIEFQVS